MELNIKHKKGIFYTLDALILLFIVASALFLIADSDIGKVAVVPDNFISEDVMRILSEMKLTEVNQTWLNEKVTNGDIDDVNRSVLTQLGDFWSSDNITLAQELASTVLNTIPAKEDFSLWIGNEKIYESRNQTTPASTTLRAWRIVSGIEKAKPFKGFVSSARANSLTKNQTLIVTVSPEGAGWDEGTFTVTKYFNLSNFTLHSSNFIASVDTDSGINDFELEINGDNSCRYRWNDINWFFGTDESNVGNATISTSCFVQGVNYFTLDFRNNDDRAHMHPGTALRIEYEIQEPIESIATEYSKRFYMDNIVSRSIGNDGTGVWTAFPFDIPFDAQNVSVRLQIHTRNIRDYIDGTKCDIIWNGLKKNDPCPDFYAWDNTTKPAADNDYVLFVNNQTPIDINGSPEADFLYTYPHSTLSQNLVLGTNIVAVYLNNYGDYVWGSRSGGDLELYSDWLNDPENSSYVEVNYTLADVGELPFGTVELTSFKEFGGAHSYTKTTSFTYPPKAVNNSFAYAHLIQRDNKRITVESGTPYSTQFTSPADGASPSTVMLNPDTLPIGQTNFVRASDINISNDILNISTIEFRYYVPGSVGYGGIFETQAEADSDASARLQNQLGEFVDIDDVSINPQSVTNVSTLWGPAVVEVRSWN